MKGFLKFFALVLLLVPVWIGFLTVTGEERLKQRPSVGPLVALDGALQDAGEGSWVSGIAGMEPVAATDAWRLEGLVAMPEGPGTIGAHPFVAMMHTKCLPYSNATCWVVDRLDVTPVADGSTVAMEPQDEPANGSDAVRLSIVQDQLRDLGFDPGPSDGVMGLRTQQAIGAYIGRIETSGRDVSTGQALVELEKLGRLARAKRDHAQGDYHAAIAEYAKVVELDPTDERGPFNRGLIFSDLGLPGLAITNFDMALALRDDHVMAYHGRGNAHFAMGDYWHAFADHTDGLALRYFGHRYLVFRERLGEARSQLAPELAAVFNWAEGAWDQARHTFAETLRHSNEAGEEKAT